IIHSYKKEYFKKIVSLLRSFLGNALKDNIYLQTGILTGVFRIAKAQIFSGLNNIEEFSILDKQLAKYFGFLEDEVDELFKYLDVNLEKRIEIQKKAKNWYNGYSIGGYTIYNPWSIMSCLKREGLVELYWIQT